MSRGCLLYPTDAKTYVSKQRSSRTINEEWMVHIHDPQSGRHFYNSERIVSTCEDEICHAPSLAENETESSEVKTATKRNWTSDRSCLSLSKL